MSALCRIHGGPRTKKWPGSGVGRQGENLTEGLNSAKSPWNYSIVVS